MIVFSNDKNTIWMISELGSVNQFDCNSKKVINRFSVASKNTSLASLAFPNAIAVSPKDESILLLGLADGRMIKCDTKQKNGSFTDYSSAFGCNYCDTVKNFCQNQNDLLNKFEVLQPLLETAARQKSIP